MTDPAAPAAPAPMAVAGPAPGRLRGVSPLVRNASLLLVSTLVLSGLGFLFWVVAARGYSAPVVGRASAVVSAVMLVSGIAQLGLATLLVRYLPGAGARTRRTVTTSYAASAVATVAAAVVALVAFRLLVPELRFVADDPVWAAAFVLGCTGFSIFSLQDSVLTGLRETRWVPVENTAFSLLRLGLLVAFASGGTTAGLVAAALLPAALLVVPVNAAVFRRFVPRATAAPATGTWTRADVLRLGLGNYVGNVASLVSVYLLPVVVVGALGERDAAFFYMPWTIGISLGLVASTLATSLVVEASYDEARAGALARASLRGVVRVMLPVSVVVTLASPYILRVFGEAYATHGDGLMRLLALSVLPQAVATIGIAVARMRHDGRLVAVVQVVVAVLGVGLAAALMPSLGIAGVGAGWLVSQCVAAALVVPGLLRAVRAGG